MNRKWTKEDVEYLKEKWGTVSIPYIAQKLNRSVNAIKLKAGRLNLGPMLENGSYVTLNQVAIALTGRPFSSYYKKSWIENRGMPVHNKRINSTPPIFSSIILLTALFPAPPTPTTIIFADDSWSLVIISNKVVASFNI